MIDRNRNSQNFQLCCTFLLCHSSNRHCKSVGVNHVLYCLFYSPSGFCQHDVKRIAKKLSVQRSENNNKKASLLFICLLVPCESLKL